MSAKKTVKKKTAAKADGKNGNEGKNDERGPELVMVDLADLVCDPENVRRSWDEDRLRELAESIWEVGIQQPLRVIAVDEKEGAGRMPASRSSRYQVVIGNRRTMACQYLKGEKSEEEWLGHRLSRGVPCLLLSADEAEMAKELQLVENLQREDVSPVDEALGYTWLREHGREVETIARRIGRSKDYVWNRMKLAQAPAKLLEALDRGEVTIRICEKVGRVPRTVEREELAERVLKGPQWEDRPLNEGEVDELIREDYMVSLSKAPWDWADAELAPENGDCVSCPHRTGNMEGLALSVNDSKGRTRGTDPNVCTAPGCFRGKMRAFWERRRAEAEEDGQRVLTAAEGEKWFRKYTQNGRTLEWNAPFVVLSEPVDSEVIGHYDAKRTPSWGKLLSGCNLEIVLGFDPHRERVVELVDRTDALAALKEKAASRTAGGAEGSGQKSEGSDGGGAEADDSVAVDWGVIAEHFEGDDEEDGRRPNVVGSNAEWQKEQAARQAKREAEEKALFGVYAQIADRMQADGVTGPQMAMCLAARFQYEESDFEFSEAFLQVMEVPKAVIEEGEEKGGNPITNWLIADPEAMNMNLLACTRLVCLWILADALLPYAGHETVPALKAVAESMGIEWPIAEEEETETAEDGKEGA